LTVEHRARSLQQGEVVLIRVSASVGLSSITADFQNRPIPLFDVGEQNWAGLIGIDLAAKPGAADLVLKGRTSVGKPVEATYRIDLSDKEFPVRRLKVDSKYVNPPAEVMARIQEESRLVADIFTGVDENRYWKGAFLRPVPGEASSSFGKRSILNGVARSPHSGTDFRASKGTPIKSPNHGKVVLVRDLYYAGNTVIIDHGMGLFSYFAHLSAFRVSEGQMVEKGEVVGLVGATGRVTGPHLHWSLRLGGARVDPLSLLELAAELE
jgi:murein DD-endopeptidase MepM/ murein hydrolase activator NlpD